jgi:hypothetical protein
VTPSVIASGGFDERCSLQNGAENSQKAVATAYVDRSRAAVQIRTGRRVRTEVECSMGIDRDDCAERQARVDRMVNEFREAQARRVVKPNDKTVESKPDAKTKVPLPAISRSTAFRGCQE